MVEPILASTPRTLALDPEDWLAGASAAMIHLRGQIRRIAPYFRTALLTGERGCGDFAAAHMLHQMSPRRQAPFFELTQTAAERLLGGEASYAPLVSYGMVYVRHPERLSRTMQRALLRLLRERGAQAPRLVVFAEKGVRPLIATVGILPELGDALAALRITLPTLRERREDTPGLFRQMLHKVAVRSGLVPPELAPDLLEAVMRSSWPGNLPQMQTAIESLIGDAKAILRADDLRAVLGALPSKPPREKGEVPMVTLDTVIHDHIRAVLFACNGNKLRTAEVLGISRSTLYRMLEAQTVSSISLDSGQLSMAG